MQLRRDARAGVNDVYFAPGGGGATRNINAAAVSGVLDRVVQQVQDHAAQQRWIAANQAFRGSVDGQLNIFFARQRVRGMRALRYHFLQINVFRGERVLARVGARQREEIFDDFD